MAVIAAAQKRLTNPKRFWKFLRVCCPGGDSRSLIGFLLIVSLNV